MIKRQLHVCSVTEESVIISLQLFTAALRRAASFINAYVGRLDKLCVKAFQTLIEAVLVK